MTPRDPAPRRRASRACAALLVLVPGCRFEGVAAPGPLAAEVAQDPLLGRPREPLPIRVGVAPLRVTFTPAADASRPRLSPGVPDLEALRRAFVEALRAAGLFAAVEARGRAADGPAAALDAAWAAGDDALLEVDLERWWRELLGHPRYVPWLLLYLSYVWPAWFVPVDRYGIGAEATMRLRSLQRGAPIHEARLHVSPERTAQDLRPFDRELVGALDVLALWNVEASLDDSNWDAIERAVAPHAARRLALDVARGLAAWADDPAADPARAGKRLALVVGVSRHEDARLGALAPAARDAVAVAEAWQALDGLQPGRDLTLLLDAQATRAAVLEAVASLARRAGPLDDVVVYWSGRGAPGGRLVPWDGQADDLAGTTVSPAELLRALSDSRARGVALIADAGFSGAPDDARTVPGSLGPSPRPAVSPPGPRQGALLGAAQDGAALDLLDAGSGLFTAVLLAGWRGAADADADARVTWAELCAFVLAEVPSRAGLEGGSQTPVAAGDAGGLRWPR